MTDTAIEREVLTWDGFGEATRDLARAILESGFETEVVVAIARGGLLPAGAIAYGLGAKNCGAINVEFYTGIGTVLDAPEVLPPALDMEYLNGRRVLLVDDVADSGRTLALAVQLLRDKGADVRSVTIYTKPTTIIQPDYAWKDTDRWIDFPWSAKGTVREEDLGPRADRLTPRPGPSARPFRCSDTVDIAATSAHHSESAYRTCALATARGGSGMKKLINAPEDVLVESLRGSRWRIPSCPSTSRTG